MNPVSTSFVMAAVGDITGKDPLDRISAKLSAKFVANCSLRSTMITIFISPASLGLPARTPLLDPARRYPPCLPQIFFFVFVFFVLV